MRNCRFLLIITLNYIYALKGNQQESSDFFALYDLPSQLTEEHRNILEVPITAQDISTVLDSLKVNKSPGLDGLTTVFF